MTAKKLRPASAAEAATEAITRPNEKELEAQGQTVLEATKPEKVEEQKKRPSLPNKKSPKAKAKPKTKPEPKEITEPEPEQVKNGEKSVMGQPRKYEEACKHVSFSLPLSVIENLKILSQFAGVNQTQFILSLVNTEFEKNKAKVEAFRELMKK